MTRYRRAAVAGGTYFFTVVTYRRRSFLTDEEPREWLREATKSTRADHPFEIDAWVLLPDHLHCIWTLPAADADYSMRWALIKPGRVGMVFMPTRNETKYSAECWMAIWIWINDGQIRYGRGRVGYG